MVGSIDLTRFAWEWRMINDPVLSLEAADVMARDSNLFTDRRFDEAQACGLDTYIAARGLIAVALDNGQALMDLLTSRGASVWAPWVLLRATFEASAWALWLLEPDSGLERRRRGLRRMCEDNRQWELWVEVFAKPDRAAYREFKQRRSQIHTDRQRDAEAVELTVEQAMQKPNLTDELPKLRTLQSAGQAANLWGSLSGMDHGLPYAMMGNTGASRSRPIPGGEHQMRSMNELA